MNYLEVIDSIFSKKPLGASGRSELEAFLPHWGNPHKRIPVVHVTGTNGKGQTTAKIAAALQAEGYRVGRYISPHLFRYEERIAVNGEPIPSELVVEYTAKIQEIEREKGLYLNFFSHTTAIAFRYFFDAGVDIAVMEVGIGGKYDATNVCFPVLSVITSISHDHVELFGTDLDKIAEEKGGIIKPYVPVIVGPHAHRRPIVELAKERFSPLYLVEPVKSFYDLENEGIAKKALEILSYEFPIDPESVATGLKARLPCRFEKRGRVLFDVAHNPNGFSRLNEALSHFYPRMPVHFVIGMAKTKARIDSLKAIEERAARFHFVHANDSKAVDASTLLSELRSFSQKEGKAHPTVADGIREAVQMAKEEEPIVVCGSFYIMADAIAVNEQLLISATG